MDFVVALAALCPLLMLLVLLVLRTRQLWAHGSTQGGNRSGGGGDPAGDREPRRPLVPAGSPGLALPEPSEDAGVVGWPSPVAQPVDDPGRELRAS